MTGRQPPFRFAPAGPPPRATFNAVPLLLRGAAVVAVLLAARALGWPL